MDTNRFHQLSDIDNSISRQSKYAAFIKEKRSLGSKDILTLNIGIARELNEDSFLRLFLFDPMNERLYSDNYELQQLSRDPVIKMYQWLCLQEACSINDAMRQLYLLIDSTPLPEGFTFVPWKPSNKTEVIVKANVVGFLNQALGYAVKAQFALNGVLQDTDHLIPRSLENEIQYLQKGSGIKAKIFDTILVHQQQYIADLKAYIAYADHPIP